MTQESGSSCIPTFTLRFPKEPFDKWKAPAGNHVYKAEEDVVVRFRKSEKLYKAPNCPKKGKAGESHGNRGYGTVRRPPAKEKLDGRAQQRENRD